MPTEDVFFTEYLKWMNISLTDKKFRFNNQEFNVSGLKCRILRTYPSLIRDIHFYYFLLESKKFDDVKYSLKKDLNGTDLTISKNGIEFCVSIFIDSLRSNGYKIQKEGRHNYSTVKEIRLNVVFKEMDKVGEFYLLGEKHLNHIEEVIKTFR